ncbi:MCE family protein [bacterium]|nr:MCE family protein [bacterium]MBU1993485.1 MCE family protein [bacterium]
MQYSKMKLAVGIFVITLVITIGTFLYLLLDEKGTFDKRYSFYFDTESANSFNVGMPLKFSGFKIGVIDEIALTDEGSVHMTFSVSADNKKWISKDSVLILKKPLIGSAHIEVYSAIGNEPLQSGSTLEIMMSDDINDMISKLEPAVNKLINIISSIDTIASYLAKGDSDLIQTMRNIKIFSENLSKNDALLTSITGDDASTHNIINSLNTVAQIINDIQKITASLDKEIINPSASTIRELEGIMQDIKQKLDSLDPAVKTLGSLDKDIVELKEQISVGMQKSNQIMDKVDSLMQDEKKSEVILP